MNDETARKAFSNILTASIELLQLSSIAHSKIDLCSALHTILNHWGIEDHEVKINENGNVVLYMLNHKCEIYMCGNTVVLPYEIHKYEMPQVKTEDVVRVLKPNNTVQAQRDFRRAQENKYRAMARHFNTRRK